MQQILDELDKDTFSNLSLCSLGVLTADEIFGEAIDVDNESLFLAAMIDETQPLQSELVAKLNTTFEDNKYLSPDRYSCQVFKRKAGYSARDKNLSELGQYCVAICVKDYQIVKFKNEEHMIPLDHMSPLFELLPGKKADRPSVPFNRTQIKLGNGKATIKQRKYMSVLIWAFWDGNPIKENNTTVTDTSPLQDVLNKLASQNPIFEETISNSVPEKGIIIS